MILKIIIGIFAIPAILGLIAIITIFFLAIWGVDIPNELVFRIVVTTVTCLIITGGLTSLYEELL